MVNRLVLLVIGIEQEDRADKNATTQATEETAWEGDTPGRSTPAVAWRNLTPVPVFSVDSVSPW